MTHQKKGYALFFKTESLLKKLVLCNTRKSTMQITVCSCDQDDKNLGPDMLKQQLCHNVSHGAVKLNWFYYASLRLSL